ncbi:histidinol-phosphatase [Patescibacteria group bacterium]|nr:histidinol-phosphatase [Patescibacteria group bacterium]MBU1016417.1 histidinol-phosphatase [Patescibacteria group bacterium]MBU1685165.1 histidinol-phosphatase [Patescibacteria group bacterium]MBU1938822.1 histidinol-phosphatase [Patescibacteria group bacterium]
MLIDYHLHNHFSPDSREDTRKIVEKAIEMGIKEICITNHPELHDKNTGKGIFRSKEARDRFRKIKAELDDVQKEHPGISIGFGVELEYVENWMDELTEFVKETDFDFILGSVHIVRSVIISSHLFADELYSKTDEQTAYNAYFDNMMSLVEWGHLDVVAHFDINKKFGHKFYGPFQPEKYKDRIIPILERMKEKGIGLELNTKCMDTKCKELFPHPVILNWAVEVGINNFTFGSDAHKAKDVGQFIQEAMEIAKKAGIKSISTYSKRIPTLHAI